MEPTEKKERLNDKWLRIAGLPLLSLFSTFVTYRFVHDEHGNSYLKVFLVSLVLIAMMWEVCRQFLIQIRIKWPGTHNLLIRSIAQVVITIAVMIVLVCGALWITDITNFWGYSLGLHFYLRTLAFGFPQAILVIIFYELIYYFNQWRKSFMFAEMLKKENLQVQLDSLKNQVNPHFLFNSLNTLSYMIDTDTSLAKRYVNELAVVYRNILESNEKALNTLREELEFIQSYFFLLHTRFGTHFKEEISVSEQYLDRNIPPLTLQMLVENAVKHNVISASHPLTIRIYVMEGDVLIVSNNVQKIPHSVISNKVGLENIISKYRLLKQKKVTVNETANSFEVILPLISHEISGADAI